jgi:hypothetical protein
VAGSYEGGDEPSDSGAMELVSGLDSAGLRWFVVNKATDHLVP